MKKRIWIPIVIILLVIMLVPVPYGVYKDGGTREYGALLYRIVDWHRLTDDGIYEKTCVYFGLDRFKSIDELWEKEYNKIEDNCDDDELSPDLARKPVIYLYPEAETEISVKLHLDGRLTCTYPSYVGGWNVTARPDGTLTDEKGQTYSYLYWEGVTDTEWDMSSGFCIRGEDTAEFLEKTLEKLGLTRREANEFIVYWLPIMEQNKYNIISFQTDEYTEAAKLDISPKPDTLIRVFMTFKASESFVNIPSQELSAPERTGFTAVEWGGSEIN